MSIERQIRLIAGSLILISLGLAVWVNGNFLWLTAFVGANLFQSAITKWCLMEDILRKFENKEGGGSCCGGEEAKHS
ncbi:MAG TPA: DUF2892 domain-containing protein [Elusimicrobia bacterium]|nr:DUF2892 domain-containing protein [Elusimicrobiota bacterium]HBT62778.1 DUF2892 domain-containing protein [Elusimicrobiota bacterium]